MTTRNRRVTTSVLNEIMLKEIDHYPPPMSRGIFYKDKVRTAGTNCRAVIRFLLQSPGCY